MTVTDQRVTDDDATQPPTARPLGPHGMAQRVDCRICSADIMQPCRDDDGTPRPDPHHSRWIRYQRLVRRQPFFAVALRDLPTGSRSGDALVCVATSGGRLDALADSKGHRFAAPVSIAASDVRFRAFLDEHRGRVRGPARAMRRSHAST